MHSDSHQQLVQTVAQAPSRAWITEFFDLLNGLLAVDGIDPTDNDPRLVTSIRKTKDRIAISMNIRYVLLAAPDRGRIGFIIGSRDRLSGPVREQATVYDAFDSLQGEAESETPKWVSFEGAPSTAVTGSVRENWIAASRTEFNRWKGSPHRAAHKPVVRRAAVDEEYRERVFEDAFGVAGTS